MAFHRPEGDADGFHRDGVDVSAERSEPQLVRFADGRARTHEGIKDRQTRESMTRIERLGKIRVFIESTTKQDATKDRAQAIGPPFMYVVNGAMDFLPPALALAKPREELESEIVGFNQSLISHPPARCCLNPPTRD